MTRRLLVNDALSQLGEITFWHRLIDWFGCEFVGGDYATLADDAYRYAVYKVADEPTSLIIRNASWFPPIKTTVPTISLLQDIIAEGPQRKMQEAVAASSHVVFNSSFTASQYPGIAGRVIPLPVDFGVFEPQNAMGCQQALGLPDGGVCWVGALQGATGQVKGWDVLRQVARLNPDIPFACVFKDAVPEVMPPNMRCYARLPQAELVKVMGACRVGLCTSRTESQHLAGIEMGACGLPMVAPPVGVYWKREGMPGVVVEAADVTAYAMAIRGVLAKSFNETETRNYWRPDFDIEVVRAQWETLVREVECAGAC